MGDHGDNVLFNKIYRENAARLFYMAYGDTHDYHISEDLVQETFIEFFFGIERLRDHPNIPGWLTRTHHFRILRELDRAYRRNEVPLLEGMELPSMDVYRFSLSDSFPAGMRKTDRDLLIMYYEQELRQTEIADKLGINENTVNVRIHRARDRFRKLYLKEKRSCCA